jgi:hypothetical protein
MESRRYLSTMESEAVMNPDPIDAAEALRLADRSRAKLADRELSPWWYAPLYGLGLGGFVASPGLRDQLVPLAMGVSLILLGAIYAAWSRGTGVTVSNWRAGRTLPISLAVLALVLLASGAGLWLKHEAGVAWAPLAAGVFAGLAGAVGSRLWDAAWLADIRDGR